MYNSQDLCFDKELCFLSYGQPINAEFAVNEILTEDLWKTYQINDNLYKAIPLFNCDLITSSNQRDIVLEDNKCVILHVDSDTIIKAISDDVGSTHHYSLQLYAYAPYTTLDIDEVSVYCIVYDEFLNTLNGITINVLVDGYQTAQIITDNQGIGRYTVTNPCEILFEYNGNVSNSVIIAQG